MRPVVWEDGGHEAPSYPIVRAVRLVAAGVARSPAQGMPRCETYRRVNTPSARETMPRMIPARAEPDGLAVARRSQLAVPNATANAPGTSSQQVGSEMMPSTNAVTARARPCRRVRSACLLS